MRVAVATTPTLSGDAVEQARAIPDWAWASPASVAEAGSEGMLRGRRTVTPGLANRIALGPAGRLMPRGIGLPALRAAVEARRRAVAG